LLHHVAWQKFTDVTEVLVASIIRAITLMMEAASTSKTSETFYQTTWHNNPEDSHLVQESVSKIVLDILCLICLAILGPYGT
jgi:hypothetical protein